MKKAFPPKFIRFFKFSNSNGSVCKYTPFHTMLSKMFFGTNRGMDVYDIIIFEH